MLATITDKHGANLIRQTEDPSKQTALIAIIKGLSECEGKGESSSCKKMLNRCFDCLLCINKTDGDNLAMICRVLAHINTVRLIEEQSILKMLKRVISEM